MKNPDSFRIFCFYTKKRLVINKPQLVARLEKINKQYYGDGIKKAKDFLGQKNGWDFYPLPELDLIASLTAVFLVTKF